MIYNFLYQNLNFLYENLNFLYENLRFSLLRILIFFLILLTIPKISYYKVGVSTASIETHWLGSSVLMVYRNNADRLGSGFISMCLETKLAGWVKKAVSMCRNDPVVGYGFRGIVTASDGSNQKGGK